MHISVIWKSIVQTIENRPCMAIALLKLFPFLLIEQALYIAQQIMVNTCFCCGMNCAILFARGKEIFFLSNAS